MIFSALDLSNTRKTDQFSVSALMTDAPARFPYHIPPSPSRQIQFIVLQMKKTQGPERGMSDPGFLRKNSDLCLEPADCHMVKITGRTLPGPTITRKGLGHGVGRGQESSPHQAPSQLTAAETWSVCTPSPRQSGLSTQHFSNQASQCPEGFQP